MRGFLRYNCRHHFFWQIRGPESTRWPRLNPITSSYGPHVRNVSWHEPVWLFKLRQRAFAFAGKHRCPDRGSISSVFVYHTDDTAPDTWDIGPDGNRTCSYCGSIHFDDLIAICRRVPGDDRYGVERTTKAYKVYVKQPGVRNAAEGAIKFYMCHAPANPTEEQQLLFGNAVNITSKRFQEKWDAWVQAGA